MIELLKSGQVDNSLLCELAAHPDFPRLMADLEIYVNGVAVKQVQTVNAIVDTIFIFAVITLLAGIYIGYTCQNGINTDILLALLMIGNALLIISTVKNVK